MKRKKRIWIKKFTPESCVVGAIFNRWTVIEPPFRLKYRTFVKCKCSCGTERVIQMNALLIEMSRSCGCLLKEVHITHGMTHTPEYRAWRAMKSRCLNPKAQFFSSYGGRGVRVCEKWMKFEGFLEDMGPKPSRKFSLDRFPNNDGNYEKSNCRWATNTEQQNNKRDTRIITLSGRTQTVAMWAKELGLSSNTVKARIKSKWSDKRILSTPSRQQKSHMKMKFNSAPPQP